MNEFKPNKGKALMNAVLQEANDKAELVVAGIAQKYPQAAAVLGVLQASFGARLAYKQEKLNQFTEYLMKNLDVFTKDVIAREDFQDGLIVAIESYFRLRTEEKRKLAEKIFYDFGKSASMPLYPLERYTDTLEKISQNGIRLLGFIHHEIPKVKLLYAEEKMRENGNGRDDETRKRMIEIYTREPLSKYVGEYIKKQAVLKVKKRNGEVWAADLQELESEMREQFSIGIGELEQLGLARSFHQEGLGWGAVGQNAYNLTDYGRKFTSIIKPDNE